MGPFFFWHGICNGVGIIGNPAIFMRRVVFMTRTYNIFISHSWGYGDDYETLTGFLYGHPYFSWRNYSVPKDDPIHNARSRGALRAALQEKIRHASCVIVPAGVYCTYSDWIEEEIDIALEMGKPIIGVRLRGAERISSLVQASADIIVGWNSDSVVDAVRNYSI